MKKSFLTALALSILSTAAISAHAQSNTVPGLPAGMSVQIEKQGTGAQPVATDRVTVNYVGTLANGTVFDSSYKRGTPASFSLDQVVPAGPSDFKNSKLAARPSWFARRKPHTATTTSVAA
jgi:FKBP-type peptidyl-prolyl cis-trans isomerase FkpA